jgi:hypothetical protein
MDTKRKVLIAVFLIFGLSWLLFLRLGEFSHILHISKEDGPVEYLTASFYLVGFVVGIYSIYLIKKTSSPIFLAILWTILCFVFLGEETSWFQRVFNYSVPSVEAASNQNEFNFHNLKIFTEEGMVSEGKVKRKPIVEILASPQNLFRIGFFGYFLLLPIFHFNKKIRSILANIGYLRPSLAMILSMLIVFLFSFALLLFSPLELKPPIAESREMLYALFILTYMVVFIKPRKINF